MADLAVALKQGEEALATVRRGTKDHYGAAAMLFRALGTLLDAVKGRAGVLAAASAVAPAPADPARSVQTLLDKLTYDETMTFNWLVAVARESAPAPLPPAAAEARTRYATRPSRGDNRVPYCDEQCPQHDGKRCRIMGCRPSSICEPEVLNLLADLDASEKARKVAEEERAVASAQLDRLLALPEVEAPEPGYEDVADAVEAAFNELREERDAERSRQERAIAIVSRLQFCVAVVEGFGPVERDLCPECDQDRERGHSPDCPIGMLLSDQPSAGEPAVSPEVHVPRAEEAP